MGDDDTFSLNEAFKSKSIKVKLSAVSSQKEGEAEHMETRQKVRGGGVGVMGGVGRAGAEEVRRGSRGGEGEGREPLAAISGLHILPP